jgi:hypothetical protein
MTNVWVNFVKTKNIYCFYLPSNSDFFFFIYHISNTLVFLIYFNTCNKRIELRKEAVRLLPADLLSAHRK